MTTKDKENWQISVEEQYNKINKSNVWKPIKLKDVPPEAKILTPNCAMKKKSSWAQRERLNACGYYQVDGVNYDSANIESPVTNHIITKIVLVLKIMAAWTANILDVKVLFLHGGFNENAEPIYMYIPKIFQKYFEEDQVLLLLKTLYGLKNAAYKFFPSRVWKLKPEQ